MSGLVFIACTRYCTSTEEVEDVVEVVEDVEEGDWIATIVTSVMCTPTALAMVFLTAEEKVGLLADAVVTPSILCN